MQDDAKPLHFLRQWREFRRLTQEALAEKVGTTRAVISLLESGDRGLSDKWLRKLGPALGTRAGAILDHDPNDLPSDILEIYFDIPKTQRAQAIAVLETFRSKRDGTDG